MKKSRYVMGGLLFASVGFFLLAGVKELTMLHIAKLNADKKLSPIIRLVEPAGGTFCTAVVISDNLAITANHCVNQEVIQINGSPMFALVPSMEIRATDNIPRGVSAAPVWWDFRRDIALIKGDFTKFKPRSYLSAPEDLTALMTSKTEIVSCGYPYHGPMFCSKGRFVDRMGFHWGVNSVILPGMSGGPTMLKDGTVIGINDAVEQSVGGLSVISPTYDLPVGD